MLYIESISSVNMRLPYFFDLVSGSAMKRTLLSDTALEKGGGN